MNISIYHAQLPSLHSLSFFHGELVLLICALVGGSTSHRYFHLVPCMLSNTLFGSTQFLNLNRKQIILASGCFR